MRSKLVVFINIILISVCLNAYSQIVNTAFKKPNNKEFISSEKIVFYDDFSDYKEGTFPSRWQIENNGSGNIETRASVITMDSTRALFFSDGNGNLARPKWDTSYCHKYKDGYWTIEFDFLFVPKVGNTYNDIGIQMGLIPDYPNFLLTYGISSGSITCNLSFIDSSRKSLTADCPGTFDKNRWHHFAIAFTQQTVSCYLDNINVLNTPNLNYYLSDFEIWGRAKVALKDFKIARTDVSDNNTNSVVKLLTEKKFITHAIVFDKNKSDIKAGSMSVINELVGFMMKNPIIKLEIDGHTDNDGTPASNMKLSQDRAEAVKKQLVKDGVADNRLTTKGYGDTKPIDKNTTPEGKANNRRVEFIKL